MGVGYFIVRYLNSPDVQIAIDFERPTYVIGSDPRCDLQLFDPAVASSHVVVSAVDDCLYIKPRYTKADVLVNGALIREQVPLQVGDQIQVGDTLLEFQAEAQPSAPTATLVPARPVSSVLRSAPAARMPHVRQAVPVVAQPRVLAPAAAAVSGGGTIALGPASGGTVFYPQSPKAATGSRNLSGMVAAFISIMLLVGVGGYAAVTQLGGGAGVTGEYALYAPDSVNIVMFYADWCTYCKQQDPIVRGLQREFGESVNVEFVDVENPANRNLVARFGATSIPVTVVMDGQGEPVSIWRGLTSRQRLHRAIEKILEASLPTA